jgi:hypothetical protein
MKKINRIISKEKKLANTLYRYEIVDDFGNLEIASSIQEYKVGDQIQLIWTKLSDKYNTPYIKKID